MSKLQILPLPLPLPTSLLPTSYTKHHEKTAAEGFVFLDVYHVQYTVHNSKPNLKQLYFRDLCKGFSFTPGVNKLLHNHSTAGAMPNFP